MQVQRIQNNNTNFSANHINIDIKLKMTDITEYLKKKRIPDSELKSADLNDMFIKANTNIKNDEKDVVLTGNEIYEFFEIAWKKLGETAQDLYQEIQGLVRDRREEMWKSIERDFTPEQQAEMKNLVKLQKKHSNDMTKYARKMTKLKQDDSGKVTPEQIKQAEEGFELAAKKYHEADDAIYALKYDKSKLDTTKYVDLGDR